MKYYTHEAAKEATQERIEKLRNYAGFSAAIKKAVKAFDGKVFNCKLEKAIDEATGECFSVKKEYNHITIYAYDRGECHTFGRLALDDLIDGKRIDAAKFCESINSHRAEMLREAAALENQLANIDNILSQFDYLKKTWETMTESLEWAIIDNYSIKRYI